MAPRLVAQAARGELIVWTDDDVLVDACWLAEMARAFAERPDAAYFGGRVTPWFPAGSKAWLKRSLPIVGMAYAVLDLGPDIIELGGEHWPVGANMAFRKDVLLRHPFDPELGRKRNNLVGGEEVAVVAG